MSGFEQSESKYNAVEEVLFLNWTENKEIHF